MDSSHNFKNKRPEAYAAIEAFRKGKGRDPTYEEVKQIFKNVVNTTQYKMPKNNSSKKRKRGGRRRSMKRK